LPLGACAKPTQRTPRQAVQPAYFLFQYFSTLFAAFCRRL